MKSLAVAFHGLLSIRRVVGLTQAARWGAGAACALALSGCATPPAPTVVSAAAGRYFDPILGVWASPRLVDDGQPVPRGGGGYLVGRPYTIAGHLFVPNANPQGYTVVGTASWYGDAFHGRRTANGEIFDKRSISAAHPTLPLPSYVRVTNLKNNRSMIVRVNDRGPYHGGRVMDVSERVAEALQFKTEGTGHIKVDYIGRADLAGSDDAKLIASLREDGAPAQFGGTAVAEQGGSAVAEQGGTALAEQGGTGGPPPPAQPTHREALLPTARPTRLRGRAAQPNPQDPWSTLRGAGLGPARSHDPPAATIRFAPRPGQAASQDRNLAN